MYLRNKKKIRYIIVPVVLSYITGCQGLNKSNLGFRNEDNQNKAQGVFNTSASSQGVRSCEVLSVAGVLGPDIVRFFFPTLSEPQVLAVVGLSEKPLKDSAFNKLLDEHTSILLEKYLENKELYVKLHTYLNENSILSAIWKEEKGSSNKFDLESMIPNLVMKECSSYVLKTHVKKILSGSSPVTELTDYPDWVTEVNRIQSLMYLSALSHGNILAADIMD